MRYFSLKRRTIIASMVLLCSTFTLSLTAWADPVSATTFLKERVTKVLTLAAVPVKDATTKAKVDGQLLGEIKPLINFAGMSEASLGKHWAKRSQAEREQFIKLFEELVFYSYIKKIRKVKPGDKVEYEDEEKTSKGALVEAVAVTKKAEYELRFVLHRSPDQPQRFVTQDVFIDEVSLVQNYREQFNQIITKEGFPALIEKMKRQVAKVK